MGWDDILSYLRSVEGVVAEHHVGQVFVVVGSGQAEEMMAWSLLTDKDFLGAEGDRISRRRRAIREKAGQVEYSGNQTDRGSPSRIFEVNLGRARSADVRANVT